MPGITQLSSTLESVINLGHKANVPLIGSPSELVDGSEPHDTIYPVRTAGSSVRTGHRVQQGVYPGCGSGWVLGGWYTGYQDQPQDQPQDPEYQYI